MLLKQTHRSLQEVGGPASALAPAGPPRMTLNPIGFAETTAKSLRYWRDST